MGKPEPRLIGSCTDKQVSNSLWIGTTPSMSDFGSYAALL